MFDTGVRQFRMAMGLVWGLRLDPDNVARLVADARATIAEFGTPGAEARELVSGPFADPETRADFSDRALQRTARRLGRCSPFYERRFVAAGVDPRSASADVLRSVPPTTKHDLVGRREEFLCSDARPSLCTRTTGTTGAPAEVWMSDHELNLWSAKSALTAVLREELGEADLLQTHTSSRATAAMTLTTLVCRLTGARARLLGVIPVDQALDALVGSATVLVASPSYLADLVVAARRRGLGPADFRLRRIDAGGEILSTSVRDAAVETFGARVNDVFGMTEVMPVTAGTCSQDHLHHDITMGHVELVDLEDGGPAGPDRLATTVITPYHPFRECMPVFRYDTRDVVRALPDEPLTCDLAGLPATTQVLGKADHLLRVDARTIVARDLVEAVESLPAQPWPGRFDARLVAGRLQITLPRSAVAGLDRAGVTDHFGACGLDADVHVVDDGRSAELRRVRSDLHEFSFASTAATSRTGS